jgi:hypothetical protein
MLKLTLKLKTTIIFEQLTYTGCISEFNDLGKIEKVST